MDVDPETDKTVEETMEGENIKCPHNDVHEAHAVGSCHSSVKVKKS